MIQNQIQLAADGEIPKPTVRDSRGKVYTPKS